MTVALALVYCDYLKYRTEDLKQKQDYKQSFVENFDAILMKLMKKAFNGEDVKFGIEGCLTIRQEP